MTTTTTDDDTRLGRRVRGPGGVWRWVRTAPEPETPDRDGYQGTQPVACDTCGAHSDQVCLTINGVKRQPHPKRRGARTCGCGGEVVPRRLKCTDCLVVPYRRHPSRKGQAAARRAAAQDAAA